MPADIIRLNQFRKAKNKAAKQDRAAVNRTRHGRTKVARADDEARTTRTEHDLDGKRLHDDPAFDGD